MVIWRLAQATAELMFTVWLAVIGCWLVAAAFEWVPMPGTTAQRVTLGYACLRLAGLTPVVFHEKE